MGQNFIKPKEVNDFLKFVKMGLTRSEKIIISIVITYVNAYLVSREKPVTSMHLIVDTKISIQ